jgi:hypothetical protein
MADIGGWETHAKCLLGVAWIVPTQTALVAQGSERSSPTAIESVEACRAALTVAGRSAAFAGTAIFQVISDSQGKVTEVNPLKVPDFFSAFVQVEEFRDCVHRWRFMGPGTTTFAFSAGTTGELLTNWKMSVSSGEHALTIVLPQAQTRKGEARTRRQRTSCGSRP